MFNIRKSAATIEGLMGKGKNIDKNPWLSLDKSIRRREAILQIGANMAGAGIVTCYFFFLSVQ